MKFLIVGRTGTGKDFLASKLKEYGLTQVKSHTTRPKRSEDEESHIFITSEESSNIPVKVARTEVNGHEYFTTPEELDRCDIYIVDPNGVSDVAAACPDMTFCVIYLVSDKLERRIHAVNRAADPIKEEKVFEKRDKSEDATFYEFENLVQCASEQETFPSNITTICSVENDYGDGLLDAVKSLMNHKRMHDNVVKMAKALAEIGVLDKDPSDDNKVYLGTEDIVTYDYFADIVIKDEQNFASFTHEYLSNFDI